MLNLQPRSSVLTELDRGNRYASRTTFQRQVRSHGMPRTAPPVFLASPELQLTRSVSNHVLSVSVCVCVCDCVCVCVCARMDGQPRHSSVVFLLFGLGTKNTLKNFSPLRGDLNKK